MIIDFRGRLGKITKFPADSHLSEQVPAVQFCLSGRVRGFGILRRVIGI